MLKTIMFLIILSSNIDIHQTNSHIQDVAQLVFTNHSVQDEKIDVNYVQIDGINQSKFGIQLNEELKKKAFELMENQIKYKIISEDEIQNYKSEYTVTYMKGEIVSIFYRSKLLSSESSFSISTITFNINEGKIYKLSDIFISGSDYNNVLEKLVLQSTKGIQSAKYLTRIAEDTFYITETTLELECLFESGTVLHVSIDLSDLKDILKESI